MFMLTELKIEKYNVRDRVRDASGLFYKTSSMLNRLGLTAPAFFSFRVGIEATKVTSHAYPS